MPVDPDGFAIADKSWDLPDPPYIAGDHVAQCMGCPKCEAEEAEYYANREKYDAQREAWIAKHAPAGDDRNVSPVLDGGDA